MKREDFLKTILGTLIFANNSTVFANKKTVNQKTKLRFAIASDGHFGQDGTDYEANFNTLVSNINTQNAIEKLDFTAINGDIIHDDPKFFEPAKAHLDLLKMPYYVTQGNHDKINEAGWEAIWKMPLNFEIVIEDNVFLFCSTSNEHGQYLSPNVGWFQEKLTFHRDKKNVFIFAHIPPAKVSLHGTNSKKFQKLIKKFNNVRAIFSGHDHKLAEIINYKGINYIFDSHIGGNWGTDYKGFRIVELNDDNTIFTYLLDPAVKINEGFIS